MKVNKLPRYGLTHKRGPQARRRHLAAKSNSGGASAIFRFSDSIGHSNLRMLLLGTFVRHYVVVPAAEDISSAAMLSVRETPSPPYRRKHVLYYRNAAASSAKKCPKLVNACGTKTLVPKVMFSSRNTFMFRVSFNSNVQPYQDIQWYNSLPKSRLYTTPCQVK